MSRTLLGLVPALALAFFAGCHDSNGSDSSNGIDADATIENNASGMFAEGRNTFRFDTFGDEDFWGGKLRLHEALATLSPRAALSQGLKVDSDALSSTLIGELSASKFDLDDPANTIELLRRDAVVGVVGVFDQSKEHLLSVGIACSLCHSMVDDSITTGVGRRLDGWANRDLNVGAIVARAPDLSAFADLLGVPQDTVRQVLNSWGPGKFDALLILDGKASRPDGKSAAVLIPPAFGLAGVNLSTWTGGWGTVSYWNAFVANLEMHGKGTFFDSRLDDATQFPIAAKAGLGHKQDDEDRISGALPALHFYQLAIPAPEPPAGSFDEQAAERGDALFSGKAKCATCHTEPTGTEPGWNLHSGAEIGIDNFQADRAPDHRYRTSPLRGLWTHQKGGFFHDGRFPSLRAVVNHYDKFFNLGLTSDEKTDLVEYLKSL